MAEAATADVDVTETTGEETIPVSGSSLSYFSVEAAVTTALADVTMDVVATMDSVATIVASLSSSFCSAVVDATNY